MLRTMFEWSVLICVAAIVLYSIKALIWLAHLLFPFAAFIIGCLIMTVIITGVRRYGR